MDLHHICYEAHELLLPVQVTSIFPVQHALVLPHNITFWCNSGRGLHHEPQEGVIGSVWEQSPELPGVLQHPDVEHIRSISGGEFSRTKIDYMMQRTVNQPYMSHYYPIPPTEKCP